MMHPTDLIYLVLVSLVGAVARALRGVLPAGWRMRLEATPPDNLRPGWIWLHAVSVGELLLAEGLAEKLLDAGHRVHISTGTPAGLTLLQERIPRWDQGRGLLSGGAFPLDDPAGLRPFMCTPPGAFIALETELWPNLLRHFESRAIPRIVVNGRLTRKSSGRGGPWLRRAAGRLSLVAARDPESAEAFRLLGAPHVALGGNLKADLPPPLLLRETWNSLRAAWLGDPVIVAGSTLSGEEALALRAWMALRNSHPSLKLILAPRQPRRFDAVAEELQELGIPFHRASQPWPQEESYWRGIHLVLLDTLGELPAAYGEGTLALVGGGWLGGGGHNPLEPVRWGIPALIGPGYNNFEDLVAPLRDAGLLKVVGTEDLESLMREALAASSLRGPGWGGPASLPEGLCGALENTWILVQPFLSRHG